MPAPPDPANDYPGRAARLLVSACLLGNPVRYDGKAKTLAHAGLQDLLEAGRIVAFCPEVAGGLPIPRAAAEIEAGDAGAVLAGQGRVVTRAGEDVSAYFLAGARQALALCREHGIASALLTERSPSCGSSEVYDGSFTGRTVAAGGVTAALLRRHGIRVFSQYQIDAAIESLSAG